MTADTELLFEELTTSDTGGLTGALVEAGHSAVCHTLLKHHPAECTVTAPMFGLVRAGLIQAVCSAECAAQQKPKKKQAYKARDLWPALLEDPADVELISTTTPEDTLPPALEARARNATDKLFNSCMTPCGQDGMCTTAPPGNPVDSKTQFTARMGKCAPGHLTSHQLENDALRAESMVARYKTSRASLLLFLQQHLALGPSVITALAVAPWFSGDDDRIRTAVLWVHWVNLCNSVRLDTLDAFDNTSFVASWRAVLARFKQAVRSAAETRQTALSTARLQGPRSAALPKLQVVDLRSFLKSMQPHPAVVRSPESWAVGPEKHASR